MIVRGNNKTDWVEVHRAGAQPEIFQSRGGFVKLGHSDYRVVKNSRKKDPAGKSFEVLTLRYC